MIFPSDNEFDAFVGIDWAAAKHDICLQVPGSDARDFRIIAHSPKVIDECVCALRKRFRSRSVALR